MPEVVLVEVLSKFGFAFLSILYLRCGLVSDAELDSYEVLSILYLRCPAPGPRVAETPPRAFNSLFEMHVLT